MKKIFFYIIIFLCFLEVTQNAKAQISFESYATRLQNCNYVFEGEVILSTPYHNSAGNYIYTSNTIQISKVFKGNLTCGTVELITDDGKDNGIIQHSYHHLHLQRGVAGIFACNLTGKQLSAVDFYLESNPQKLEATYEEQSFVQYLQEDSLMQAYDMFNVYDSLNQIYNITSLITGITYTDCGNNLISSWTNTNNQTTKQTPFHFPVYKRSDYDLTMAHMNAKKPRPKNKSGVKSSAAVKTLTYSMVNATVTMNAGTKYFEFDVNLADDGSGYYFNNGLIRLDYDAATFGSNIVTANKIQVTRGTLISNTSTYDNPTPADMAANEIAIPLTLAVPLSVNLAPINTTPIQAVHVKMEIANCSTSGYVDFTNQTIMGFLSFYGVAANDTNGVNYDNINATQTLNIPYCTTTITSVSPNPVHGGTFNYVEIRGGMFENTRGNGRVLFRNADNGGAKEVIADIVDYNYWSDSLIKVTVMGTDSGYYTIGTSTTTYLGEQQVAGSGKVKVITNGGVTATSVNDLTIDYSIDNVQFASSLQKFQPVLANITGGGYEYYVDSIIWKHPDTLACVKRALHDWSCVTGVNWKVVGARNPTSLNAVNDSINMIQFGTFTDPTTVAQSTSNIYLCTPKAYEFEDDIVISQTAPFIVDTTGGTKPANTGDLYSALLHELGHAHLLNHVNDPNAIMYYSTEFTLPLAGWQRKIYLGGDNSAVDGGQYVMTRSQSTTFSGCSASTIIFKSEPLCFLISKVDVLNAYKNTFAIYPNPASETITAAVTISKSQKASVAIVDITGRTLYQSAINFEKGTTQMQIDISNLASGMYMCVYYADGNNHTAKFFKQ